MNRFQMPLQNRVTPFSEIERNPARGLFTGNRGILHNAARELVTTRWRHKAWIVCVLDYKGWRRTPMTPNRWTELFFLDEATAFAAGHRPCGFCRRDAYKVFLKLCGFAGAKDLDAALHQERTRPQTQVAFGELPHFSLFAIGKEAFLKHRDGVFRWSHSGYRQVEDVPEATMLWPLTPSITRRVLAAGYRPAVHQIPSAARSSA